MKYIFTNILDVDKLILHTLDEKSLIVMSQLNKNITKIILSDHLKHKFVVYKIVYFNIMNLIKNHCGRSGYIDVCISIRNYVNHIYYSNIIKIIPLSRNLEITNLCNKEKHVYGT